jgi:hypothetical protein
VVGTARTYTVHAISSSPTLANSQTTVSAAPILIPVKGTKLPKPTDVTLTLDVDNGKAKVTWKAGGDPIMASSYYIGLFKDGVNIGESGGSPLDTSALLDLHGEGTYTARVSAAWVDEYYAPSNPVTSAGVTYESLFAGNPRFENLSSIVDNTNTISGYAVAINLTGIGKPGVIYKVERATVDALGNTGNYGAVTLTKEDGASVVAADLGTDLLGFIKTSRVYDRTITAAVANAAYAAGTGYRYRVTATKGTDSQTRKTDSFSINPHEFIQGNISVGAKEQIGNNNVFKVTPSLDYKGALQNGDKLVLYYALVPNQYDSPGNGQYTGSITFTKAELEANPIVVKSITIPVNTFGYVKAYLEFANDQKENVSSAYYGGSRYSWNYTPDGGINNPDRDSFNVYYVMLKTMN